MGKLNPCLKRLFIFFNMLFAIVGGVLIGLAMLSQAYTSEESEMQGRTSWLAVIYFVGGITMAVALFGAYGAYREKKIYLIVFLAAMCVGCLGLLRVAIPLAVVRPEFEERVEQQFKSLVPLDLATPEVRHMAESFQSTFQCCGLFSYQDWRISVPDSCSCPEEMQGEDTCQSVTYQLSYFASYGIEKDIYKQTCFPILMSFVSKIFEVSLGILFGFSTLSFLGAVMSTIMLLQLKRSGTARPSVIFSIPTFSADPPKYTELYNPGEKSNPEKFVI